MSSTSSGSRTNVRWMIRRDLPECLKIESESFPSPWSESDFLLVLRQPNAVGVVVENGTQVLGFAIYELCDGYTHLLDIAVAPEHRRKGYGSQLISWITARIRPPKRLSLELEVRETNLVAQHFFRSVGLKATSVERGFFVDTHEDGYVFKWKAPIVVNDEMVSGSLS